MSSESIYRLLKKNPGFQQAVWALKSGDAQHLQCEQLHGSGFSFLAFHLYRELSAPLLIILDDKEEAAHYLNDLETLLDKECVHFFPSSYKRPYEVEEIDNANTQMRAEVLNRLYNREAPQVIVTYTGALFEKVISEKDLEKSILKVSTGDKLTLDFTNEVLFEYGFERVDFITEPGQFSVRGGIVDVYSYSNPEPYRIEFFGDEVESIRTFEVESQLSIKKVERIQIVPNIEGRQIKARRQTLMDCLGDEGIVLIRNYHFHPDRLDKLFRQASEAYQKIDSPISRQKPQELFMDGTAFLTSMLRHRRLSWGEVGGLSQDNPDQSISFGQRAQPIFNKRFDMLIEDLQQHQSEGFENYLVCVTEQQVQRFHDIFDEMEESVPYKTSVLPLYQGFIDVSAGILCYTDHQIFERYHRFRLRNSKSRRQAISLKELSKLDVGDYVTHIDHGIGTFGGLQKIDVNGKQQEAIKLVYGDRDILYVSIHSLHKIAKYNGKDGIVPKLHKLGSAAWKKLKQKTKSRVKKIAFDLIKLYAKRRTRKGFQYGPDSYLQHELEASFLYEDTPDQEKATRDVKQDMESERPMDRLICGDVGFGKTEIAIRAAFKAVDNGKQVAVLVPTTILAFQHARTFKQRLDDLPVTVDYLNRFRTAKEKREILEKLKSGKIDIIIGTHQLVGKAVEFKDLGLLVVDEEQKFGVSVKEKLKALKENVDVLTLTATPIPRTLQFSLMAARDLSVISTAPPNRHPIESRVIGMDQELIRDAISYEIQRGGQVFFIHNRIENIREVAGMLQRLVPDARIRIGHGQMEGKELEQLMLDFLNGAFDVLVSTTIVESGLDVTNANTIFIHNANNFGLSDLHQMRGRVGRSNKKAFCFFITPPFESLTPEARKRMEALAQYTDLGSGFQIAMKDLEIRGAGDLLGGEQSGFINEIGFDTYQKILSEAVEELKEDEFKELYEEIEGAGSRPSSFVKDVQLDTDIELLFPDDYINNVAERLNLYTELNNTRRLEELERFRSELTDRFGELPQPASDLLESMKIKWVAQELGLERVVIKKGLLLGYFLSNQESEFYQSEGFMHIVRSVQAAGKTYSLKEKQTRAGLRLLLRVDGVRTIQRTLEVLLELRMTEEVTG